MPPEDLTAEAAGLPSSVSNGLDAAISAGLDGLVEKCREAADEPAPDPELGERPPRALPALPAIHPANLAPHDPIRIIHNLTHRPPKPGQAERYERLRDGAIDLSLEFARLCPESPELEMALNGIDDAVRLAIAAIARNEP